MRVFIAIEFDKPVKEYLWKQQLLVQEYSTKGNFTIQENFHLTLNFIGEASPNQIEMLKGVINSTALSRHPFILKLDRLGQFSKGNTKIIWVGTKKSAELEATYNSLKNMLEHYGFLTDERGLNPHITLGREVVLKVDFEQLYRNINIQREEIFINKLSLMESTRVDGKLKYISIYTKNF